MLEVIENYFLVAINIQDVKSHYFLKIMNIILIQYNKRLNVIVDMIHLYLLNKIHSKYNVVTIQIVHEVLVNYQKQHNKEHKTLNNPIEHTITIKDINKTNKITIIKEIILKITIETITINTITLKINIKI